MIKKFLSKAILTAAIIGCIGGAGVMNVSAGTVSLDVTSSNVSGMVPKDPFSKMTTKSDAEQSFYITLNTLSNGPSLYFTSYNANHKKVSGALKYEKISLGNTRSMNVFEDCESAKHVAIWYQNLYLYVCKKARRI